MTTTIQVSRGLCAPIRPDVLTALKDFGFKEGEQLRIEAWGEGHYHLPVPPGVRMPDSDKWVRKHICCVTVSDKRAKWAERLLWKSGKVWLESPPLNPRLNWNAPADCKDSANAKRSRGQQYTPWSAQKGKRSTRARGGIVGAIINLFKGG